MAEALTDRPAVLMRNHGVAVVGASLAMVAGRGITLEQNAQMQGEALARGGDIVYLEFERESPGINFERARDLWKRQVCMAE